MISFTSVSKSFDEYEVLRSIDLEIQEGELMVLLGKSGSGKSTLLKMINRLVEHETGKILIDGREIQHIDLIELRRSVGYVIQNAGLFPHYTVAQNIGVVPRLQRRDKAWINEQVERLLGVLGLEPAQFIHKFPSELSGGEQQRVGIARALAGEPTLILMDEPFSALDPITRNNIRKDFSILQQQQGITTCLVTHDIMEAIEMADRICLLHQGIIQQVGSPKELLFAPANEFVQEFFKEDHFQASLTAVTAKDIEPYLGESIPKSTQTIMELLQQEYLPAHQLLEAFDHYKHQMGL
jgi:osmoprotectant transport system ATP-binding protein